MRNNKRFVVDAFFIKEAHDLNLSLGEFLLLLYYENSDDSILDFDLITKKLKISKETILEAFNNLLSKNIITLVSEKNSDGKIYDKISLDNFYEHIKETKKKEERGKLKEDIFSTFETEFRRPLSSFEIEQMKSWFEKSYSEELILSALKEAIYNGSTHIRYIDTLLHEWHKKGFTSKEDVDNYLKNKYDDKKMEDTTLFEYNWLDDNDR